MLESEASEREKADALLRDLGADEVVIEAVALRIDDEDVQGVVKRMRAFAQQNPAVVLGALSALIAGVAGGVAVAARKTTKKRNAAAAVKSEAAEPAAKPAPKRKAAKRAASTKRTLIEPHPGDKRYIRRDAKGRIKESVDVGRSLAADRRTRSKKRSKSGSGDKGDR